MFTTMYLALPVHAKKSTTQPQEPSPIPPRCLGRSNPTLSNLPPQKPRQQFSFNGIAVFDPTRQSLFFSRRRRGWLSPRGKIYGPAGRLVTHAAVTRRCLAKISGRFFGVPGLSRGNINHLWSRGYCAHSSRREKPARPRSPSSGERGECRFLFFVHPLPRDLTPESEVERERTERKSRYYYTCSIVGEVWDSVETKATHTHKRFRT